MRKKRPSFLLFIGGVIVIAILVLFTFSFFGRQSATPKGLVDQFYQYEQKGDFGSAWDLFHAEMKERFSKNAYVTERSHIYMSHFGVTTFAYSIVGEEELAKWKMAEAGPLFTNVTKVTVELQFHSKFGVFTMIQDVFVVKEDGSLKLLWEFRK